MSYSSEVLADTPLLYARLGGANSTAILVDSSGNARDGTAVLGTVTYGMPAVINDDDLAAAFRVPSSSGLQWANAAWQNVSSITLEVWGIISITGTYKSLLDRDASAARCWQFRTTNANKLEFFLWTASTGPHGVIGATTLIVDTRYHFAATYDAATGVIKVFLNGVQDGTLTIAPAAIKQGTTSLGIGYSLGGSATPTAFWDGALDEAAVYGTALSSARLLAHYQSGISVPAPTGPYAAAVLADSPLLYARLGGTNKTPAMLDSSGNARHANTQVGAPTYGQTGLRPISDGDQSCKFNGSDALRWNDAPWMRPASLTLEAWVKPAAIGTSLAILDKDYGSTGRVWQFTINTAGKLQFLYWTTAGGFYTVAGATTLVANTTYHVVATYNASTGVATLYVNGAADGTYTSPVGDMQPYLTNLHIGAGAAGGSGGTLYSHFNGWIDEVAYYGTALSAAKLSAHYTAGTTTPAPSNDLWVWNGTTEVPANVTVWNGSTETAASIAFA